MATKTIECESCHADFTAARANTKYCPLCRLIRNLTFMGTTTALCWVCDERFAPTFRNQAMCGSCGYQPRRNGTTECAFCGEDRPPIIDGVKVCGPCAHDPEQRRNLIRALIRKREQRDLERERDAV